MIRPRVPGVETGRSLGRTRPGAARRWRLLAALCVGVAPAVVGCASDEPALTMVFTRVPAVPGDITVTLAADGVTFAGADAGMPGGVSVSYAAGTIIVAIDRAYADSHSHRIRLPLKAGQPLLLMGTARIGAGATTYAAVAEATVESGRSATLTFDFGAGGGADVASDSEVSTKIAPPDASFEVSPEVFPDGGPDIAPAPDGAEAGMPIDATVDMATDTPADVPVDKPTDAPGDVLADAPVDMPVDAPVDVPSDMPDKSLDARPADSSPGDPPPVIATTCVVGGLHAASASTATGSPTVAVSTAGVFGVAWLGAAGNVLYNAVDAAGMLQNAADVPVVPAASGITFATPRLASVGADLMLAYGRRGSAGARAAVVRIAARTGAITGAEIVGANFTPATAPPEIGGVAANAAGTRVAVISRRAELATATPANVDLFSGSPGLITSSAPVLLSLTRTTGITWQASGRFVAAAILDLTSGGGRVHELVESNLDPDRTFTFTATPDIPAVGSGAATVAVAAVGGGIAVAWLDVQSCSGCTTREVFLATLDSNGNRLGEVQVSVPSTATKSYPARGVRRRRHRRRVAGVQRPRRLADQAAAVRCGAGAGGAGDEHQRARNGGAG